MLSRCDISRGIKDFRALQFYWFFVFALPIFEVKFFKAEMIVYS